MTFIFPPARCRRSPRPVPRPSVKTKIGARVSPVTRARKKSSARPFPLGTKGGITGFRSRARRTFPRPVRRLGFSRRDPRKRALLSISVGRNRPDRFDDAARGLGELRIFVRRPGYRDSRSRTASSDYKISFLLLASAEICARKYYTARQIRLQELFIVSPIESLVIENVAPDGFEPGVLV